MIDWNKYFDHVFILSRCSNFERRQRLISELARIGLIDYTILYQPDSELLAYNESTLTHEGYRCKYAHYHCCKMSYELNYDNILILEDDMVFLKDINEIENQLEIFLERKKESDIYLFDYVAYNTFGLPGYYLADFYWLNRKGMNLIIYLSEHYPNIMNDTLFLNEFSNWDGCSLVYYSNFLKNDEQKTSVEIPNETKILPVRINISPIRICVQDQIVKENNAYTAYENNNNIDVSLYNIKI